MDLPEMLTVKEIQEHLHIGHNKAYALVNLKGFPVMRLGNRWLIQKEKYLRWLEENYKSKIIL